MAMSHRTADLRKMAKTDIFQGSENGGGFSSLPALFSALIAAAMPHRTNLS